jgi:glycine dehydrogenase subunit 2
MDVAKRLLDYGFHAPTVYFPLVVPEAMMIEPTETESKETLDAFADVLIRIAGEDAKFLQQAPHNLAISRPDEVKAAKEPILRWRPTGAVAPTAGDGVEKLPREGRTLTTPTY